MGHPKAFINSSTLIAERRRAAKLGDKLFASPTVGGPVNCPHYANENPEGRKFCFACAKPMTAQPAARVSAPLQNSSSSRRSDPKLNKMAAASLILGFFSLIPPLGIAAVVFGHVSRSQIAKRGARKRDGNRVRQTCPGLHSTSGPGNLLSRVAGLHTGFPARIG